MKKQNKLALALFSAVTYSTSSAFVSTIAKSQPQHHMQPSGSFINHNNMVIRSRTLSQLRSTHDTKKESSLLSKSEQLLLFETYKQYKNILTILESKSITDEFDLPIDIIDTDSFDIRKYPLILRLLSKLTNYSSEDIIQILSSGPNARECLLLQNMGLVHFVVQRITNSSSTVKLHSLCYEDLIQEGVIGLSRAIDKYDHNKQHNQASFSTYATFWIKASVLRSIAQRDDMIRVPEYITTVIRKLNQAIPEIATEGKFESERSVDEVYYGSYGAYDQEKELASRTGLNESVVREALAVQSRRQWNRSKGGYLALEDWMISERYNGDLDVYGSSSSSKLQLERDGYIQHLKDSLSPFLSSKELQALSFRYGLNEEINNEKPIPTAYRDYEAEADHDLFGPGGILSSTTSASTASKSFNHKNSKYTQTSSPHVLRISSIPTKGVENKGGRWGEAMSFAEVGEQMRVSAEYGRRLCASALKKLKIAAEDGRLDPALLF